jgi:putative addiction module component (TIGR02574 family)
MMSETLETLKSQLVALPPGDRAELADFLIDSLEEESEGDVDATWNAELDRRMADIRSGQVTGKPAEQIFAELRERFP